MEEFKVYVYFISFTFPGGNGNTDVTMKGPIDCIEDIKNLQEGIQKREKFSKVCIDNYKLLRTEYQYPK